MTKAIRLLASLPDLAKYADQWNALAGALGEMAIFHDADATLANLQVRMNKRRAIPHVLAVFEDGILIAAAPMVWEPGWAGLGVLQWADSDTPLPSGMLCRPDHEVEVFPLLGKELLAQPGLRKIKVDYVPDRSALARFCMALRAKSGKPFPLPYIDLSVGPVMDRLSSKRRRDLRAYRRKLEAMGPVVFEQQRSSEDLADIIAWIFEFKRHKLAGHDDADWIQRPQVERYFQELAMRQAAHGRAVGHRLRVGDRTAAASLTFRHDDTAFYSKIAYDPHFAAGSPGWQELLELSEDLRADGIRTINLMIGPGFVKEQAANGFAAVRNWRLTVNPVAQFVKRSLTRSG